ncbi:MAG: acriflavin resistance protein [Planctomycetaceae bacterium]|nr:acriflavin resistance protein [Planctomycetaceae bacterium]
MNPISAALRRPITVMVLIVGVAFAGVLAYSRMKIDIFPALDLPVIYVCQPYGGMDPQQMEGLIANYYEYHILYVGGIHHVESRNVPGTTLIKLYFHPGTDMAQAMAETVAAVNRSRAFMPPGTVPPFVMRYDTGSVPVGYLVLSSETKTIGQIQDQALFKVRPMFASIPGVSAPPPFGGSARTVVVRADPQRLLSYDLSADQVVQALTTGNTIAPSGQIRDATRMPIVPSNAMVMKPEDLGTIEVKPGVFMRDIVRRDPVTDRPLIDDASDITTGYALVNGKRAVYILVTKRAEASTLDVVDNVRANLGKMQAVLPDDIKVTFEFDQSPYVTNSMKGVAFEGLIAAGLVGLMVLLFLRDWRSVVVVVLNIPLALIAALVALWLTGQSINLMTLGGFALAVGILVDEATVEVENIHTQMAKHPSVALAVRLGNMETAVPRLLAMLCVLAVFIPSFVMQGAARGLFVPLSLAVGFSMIASYILSSTFVPVLCVWLLKHRPVKYEQSIAKRSVLASFLRPIVAVRWVIVPVYFVVAGGVAFLASRELGTEIFPQVDAGQFQFRLKAPTGTRIEQTEAITQEALRFIAEEAGSQNVAMSLGFVGIVPPSNPINAVYQWMGGPEESVMRVALKPGTVRIDDLKARLRAKLPGHLRTWTAEKWKREGLSADVAERRLTDLRLSFEPADIVNEVMSLGSPSPIEVVVSGPKMADNLAHATKVYQELGKVSAVVDLRYVQALDYPTVEVEVDREKLAPTGATALDATNALTPFTSSSRFMVPNYWRDPASGIGYQVQIEVPFTLVNSVKDLELIPVQGKGSDKLLIRDIGRVKEGTMPGQIDRYNMRRVVSISGNIQGEDLGEVARQVGKAVEAAGTPPQGVQVDVRGQVSPFNELFRGLGFGLIVAVVVIALLLLAYFQSFRLAFVAVAPVPAVLAGVAIMLLGTGTTLNLQSFMGAIMAVGVATANAILFVTFAERARVAGMNAREAGIEGAKTRVRPILMTSFAMIAGMIPMALGLGDGGDQVAPLGRAVIGGLAAATLTTLLVLPAVFALIMGRLGTASASLDPFDPASSHYVPHADPHSPEVSHAS